jgi:ketosteroid isomerase-like protein
VNNNEDAVNQVLTDYYKAFSTLTIQAILRYFHHPALLIGPSGVIALPTAEAVVPIFGPVMETLRQREYHRSEFNLQQLRLLGATSALAMGVAIRYKTGGQEMERVGLTYLLHKGDSGWKFAVMALHDADRLAPSNYAQQSHWATADDKTAQFMIEMERKWAEGPCTNNGVVSELLADDFQGTSTTGERYSKADELRNEKGPHSAHGCALDDAKVRFFGEDVAIVYGSEHAIGKDKTNPDAKQCQVWTDTWLKRNGKWQIAAAQDNKVDCK